MAENVEVDKQTQLEANAVNDDVAESVETAKDEPKDESKKQHKTTGKLQIFYIPEYRVNVKAKSLDEAVKKAKEMVGVKE